MRKLACALLACSLISSVVCLAQDFTFEWDAPTSYTDGKPLDPNKDLSSYYFYRDGLLKKVILAPAIGTAPPTTYKSTEILSVGNHDFWVLAADRLGRKSGPSNTLTVSIAAVPTPTPTATPQPNPPASLRRN